jgi:hypothetical protein
MKITRMHGRAGKQRGTLKKARKTPFKVHKAEVVKAEKKPVNRVSDSLRIVRESQKKYW